MDVRRLVKHFTEHHLPHWEGPFCELVLEHFPRQLPEKASLLELCCSNGELSRQVAERLPPAGRLIATDEVRELMDRAREEFPAAVAKKVYFKREDPRRLTFASATFDGVLCAGLWSGFELPLVLEQCARVLRKDGWLLLGLALRGSFAELIDVFREVLEKEDLLEQQEGLEGLLERFPRPARLQRQVTELDFIDVRLHRRRQRVRFSSGMDFISSVLVQRHCLEACLGLIRDRGWREGILAGLVRALDTYFPEGVELTLELGLVQAEKL